MSVTYMYSPRMFKWKLVAWYWLILTVASILFVVVALLLSIQGASERLSLTIASVLVLPSTAIIYYRIEGRRATQEFRRNEALSQWDELSKLSLAENTAPQEIRTKLARFLVLALFPDELDVFQPLAESYTIKYGMKPVSMVTATSASGLGQGTANITGSVRSLSFSSLLLAQLDLNVVGTKSMSSIINKILSEPRKLERQGEQYHFDKHTINQFVKALRNAIENQSEDSSS